MKKNEMNSQGEIMLSFNVPVVVILSEVGGSDDMAYAADRALGLTTFQKYR